MGQQEPPYPAPPSPAARLDRRGFIASAAALAAVPPVAAAPPATATRRDEVQLYRQFAETTHPRGREAAADTDWRARADALAREADALPYAAYITRMFALAAWFRDGHTTFFASALEREPFSLKLPWAVRAFYDGLYVTQAGGEALPLLGGRVDHVGRLTAVELMRRFAAIWPANNPAWPHHDAGLLFASAGFLQGLGVIAPGAPIDLTVSTSRDTGVLTGLSPRPGADKDLTPLARTRTPPEIWAEAAGKPNYVRLLPEHSAAYVAFDEVGGEAAAFTAFTREILAAAERPGVARLVIDVRRNGGGNNFLIEPLRRELARSRVNAPGRLYILTGPATFSAAQNFVSRMERETFAIFVGEPTGGAPNHYGDGKLWQGPASGIKGMVSTLPWFDSYPMDKRIWTMPDVLAPRLFGEWLAGRDAALEAALTHVAAPLSDEADERVFYFSRPSQKGAWTPFWLG